MKATFRLTTLRRLALCVTLSCGASPAVAASFDCDKAGTPVEHAICQQQTLGELDSKINDDYLRAMGSLPAQEAAALRTEQRAWLKTRNACAGSANEIQACLTDTMKTRAGTLNEMARRATHDFDTAVSLIPDSPVNAADKLRAYQTPLASAWLVYLNHFVPASGVTAQEASKRHQMALDGLRDDDFAYSIMKDIEKDPKESKDKAVLTLLRMNIEKMDYQRDNDDDRPYVHCFIFEAQGQAAYEAFGSLYGSTRDGFAPICKPQDVIFDSPAWTALNEAFSEPLEKASDGAGTIKYSSYADWEIFELHVTVKPEDYLNAAAPDKKQQDPEQEIREWKDDAAWPKAQREKVLAAIEPARKATQAWLQNDRGWTAENARKGAENIVRQWLDDRVIFIDGSGWTGE
ncbi:lysozyme inhibitor LprI family protein [Cronobacter dublinensis]|uniref:lysozyme inhibitor LprI family protein n=1 Tax=Cronobacter dublinensis TaxID=413497 RepID=UPI000CFF2FF0|nr:lysozyme inhibitor LprI family protein [Cronobacter dublinensis]